MSIQSVTGNASPSTPGSMTRDSCYTVIVLTTADQYIQVPSGMAVGDVIEGHGSNGWQAVLPGGETFFSGATYLGGTIRKINTSVWDTVP